MSQFNQLNIIYRPDYLGGIISENTELNTIIANLSTNLNLDSYSDRNIIFTLNGSDLALNYFDISNSSDIILKKQLDFRIVSSLQLQIQVDVRDVDNSVISYYGSYYNTFTLQIIYEDDKKLLLNTESREVDICIFEDPCIIELKMSREFSLFAKMLEITECLLTDNIKTRNSNVLQLLSNTKTDVIINGLAQGSLPNSAATKEYVDNITSNMISPELIQEMINNSNSENNVTDASFNQALEKYATIEYVDYWINEAVNEIHSTIGEKLLTLTGEM